MILLFLHAITLMNRKYPLHIRRESWLMVDCKQIFIRLPFYSLHHQLWREFHFCWNGVSLLCFFMLMQIMWLYPCSLIKILFILSSLSSNSFSFNWFFHRVVGLSPISDVHIAYVMLVCMSINVFPVDILEALSIIAYLRSKKYEIRMLNQLISYG